MTIVQQLKCKQDFAEWCKRCRIPVQDNPIYRKRVYDIYERCWKRSYGIDK